MVYEDKNGIVTMTKMDTDEFIDAYCGEADESDEDETVWTVDADKAKDVKLYLVNTSGSMVKNKSAAKDGEDYKFNVDNYEIKSVTLEN